MRTKMSFEGGALALFGYSLLSVLMFYLLIIPGAWGIVMLYAFIARSVRLSDGSSVAFTGTPVAFLKLMLLAIAAPLVGGIIASALVMPYANSPDQAPPPALLAFIILIYIIIIPWAFYFGFRIMKWVVESFEFSASGKLNFTASIWGYLGWLLLIYISAILIILPFWVMSAMIRWMLEKTQTSSGDKLIWTGTGWGILWRFIVFYLACIVIIPIPWMAKWLLGWFVSCIEIEKAGGAAPAAVQGSGWAQAANS